MSVSLLKLNNCVSCPIFRADQRQSRPQARTPSPELYRRTQRSQNRDDRDRLSPTARRTPVHPNQEHDAAFEQRMQAYNRLPPHRPLNVRGRPRGSSRGRAQGDPHLRSQSVPRQQEQQHGGLGIRNVHERPAPGRSGHIRTQSLPSQGERQQGTARGNAQPPRGRRFPSPPVRPPHGRNLPPSPLRRSVPLRPEFIQLYWHPYEEGHTLMDNLGEMNVRCPHCGALHWEREKLAGPSRVNRPLFGSCCLQGKICLPHPHPPPPLLHRLLTVHSHSPNESGAFKARALEFRTNIRRYNSALAFVSVGTRVNDGFVNHANQHIPGAGPYTFRVHGVLHHRIGSLLPQQGVQPSYAQLYIYDPRDDAARHQMNQFRMDRNPGQDPQLMLDLHDMMVQHNPWVQVYR
jgi:hypothetical protein